MLLVVGGIVIGIAVAIAAGRLVTSQLFGLEPTDPATMALAIAVMAIVSAAAGYLPARRATRVDPMVALKEPVWHVLEGSFELLLVNAKHVKAIPGKKPTGAIASGWRSYCSMDC